MLQPTLAADTYVPFYSQHKYYVLKSVCSAVSYLKTE